MDTDGQWANLSRIIMDASGVLASVPLLKHIVTGSSKWMLEYGIPALCYDFVIHYARMCVNLLTLLLQ